MRKRNSLGESKEQGLVKEHFLQLCFLTYILVPMKVMVRKRVEFHSQVIETLQ